MADDPTGGSTMENDRADREVASNQLPKPEVKVIVDKAGNKTYKPGMKTFLAGSDEKKEVYTGGTKDSRPVVFGVVCRCDLVCTCNSQHSCSCNSHSSYGAGCSCAPVH
jgi:glyceraldehyde-3-phosphate dehydrogenase/erythrose-4-phosphate dehydrogenase